MTAFRSMEYGDGNAAKAASVVAGFTGDFTQVEPSARTLVENGYSVVAYAYANDVLLSGDADELPALIDEISEDFHQRAADYPVHRHSGASLGGGIAWNIQKNSQNPERGLYSAAGVNVAKLVMQNLVFRSVVRFGVGVDPGVEFKKRDWTPSELSEYWGEIHEPPVTGFVLALGGLDYAVTKPEAMRRVREWQNSGIDVRVKHLPLKSHTATIAWHGQHINELIELADGEAI